jgi:hypothetical protein
MNVYLFRQMRPIFHIFGHLRPILENLTQDAQHRLCISTQLRCLIAALAAGNGCTLIQVACGSSGAGALAWGEYSDNKLGNTVHGGVLSDW